MEEGTPFGRRYSPGVSPLPAESEAAEMFMLASQMLGEAGYEHYEVSNYAKPGHRCFLVPSFETLRLGLRLLFREK